MMATPSETEIPMTANFKLHYLLSLFASVALNGLIAVLIMYFLSSSAEVFWLTFGGLFAISLIVDVKRAIKTAVALLLTRRSTKESFLIGLRQANMPTSSEFSYFDGATYLQEVAKSEDADVTHRMFAAELLGAIEGIKSVAPMRALAGYLALDGAVREHFLTHEDEDD